MKKFLSKYFELRGFKTALLFVVYLTVIISVFDFNPDTGYWLKEIGRNFVLIMSITFTFYVFSSLFRLGLHPLTLKKALIMLIFCVFVSLAGGFSGWKLNEVLFGFNITHPPLFFLMIFLVTAFSAFAFNSYMSLKAASEQLARKKAAEQRLYQLKTKAELDALRSKLNPHFLFNALNSAMSLIHSDPEKAEEMLQKLANLLRSIQDKNKKEYIQLSEELETIEEYLSIEKIRFGDRLNYSIRSTGDAGDAIVPAMILQPLVENSVKHGISAEEGGTVGITASKTGSGKLIINITDSGSGFDLKNGFSGFGLAGITERLELIYGNEHSFDVKNGNGCEISITIPEKIPF